MQIYVHKNNQQLGPFTEDEIKAQLASGTITLQDHVWWQGQANWLPLGQTPLVTPGAAPLPAMPDAPLAAGAAYSTPGRTSQLAIWSLVCGCLSLFCSLIASVPAIVLGHMGLSEIKKNPGLQGRGMAMAGMILGYVFTTLIIIYIISIIVLVSMGSQVKDIFKTITSQIAAAQAAQATSNADESSTNSDQSTNSDLSTNAPDQTTSSATPTNSPSQSTNTDSSTNTPTATTPMQQ
jgi:uncharacterized membrane protein